MEEFYKKEIGDLKKDIRALKGRTAALWTTCIALTAITTVLFMHMFIL